MYARYENDLHLYTEFKGDGESTVFRKRLYKICKNIGIIPKSPYKIWKMCGTILLDNGDDQQLILDEMSHVDILHSKNYYHRNRET